ncbi:hypothetical protein FS842_008399 [Serendipita sp. 407]|nr:hypothetical protein FS842_008399 [Serendipita sp. 407]
MSMKRIQREIMDLRKEDMGDIKLTPSERSMYEWNATIPGPAGSPYEGGQFQAVIHLANDYPFSAPKVLFTTPIYHPNVSSQGQICIDILKTAWSPALSLFKVMLSLSSLMTDPNPKDPLVPSIANEYLKNKATFDKKARDMTRKHAMIGMKASRSSKPTPASTSTSTSQSAARPPPSSSTSGSGLLASIVSFTSSFSTTNNSTQANPPMSHPPQRSGRAVRQLVAGVESTRQLPVYATEVIDLDSSDSTGSLSPAPAGTRKRKRNDEEGGNIRQIGGEISGRSTRRRRDFPRTASSGQATEVIVIDED